MPNMNNLQRRAPRTLWLQTAIFPALVALTLLAACNSSDASKSSSSGPVVSAAAKPAPPKQMPDENTPAPEATGGFDGKRAFADVAKQVDFGPHPAGSQAVR